MVQPNDALLSREELLTAACYGSANASSSFSLQNYTHSRQTLHGNLPKDLQRSAALSMHTNNSGPSIAGFACLRYSGSVSATEEKSSMWWYNHG